MVQGHSNVRQVGDRIEVLLGELRSSAAPDVAAKVEEVVGLLVELYGAGLERILEIVNEDAAAAAPLLTRLTDDKFIESLLVLHGIHPVDVDTRIEAALDRARPYLGSHAGGVEYLGVDEDGVAHLVCVQATQAFLDFSVAQGKDLVTPQPDLRFRGLKHGDRWCLHILRWMQACEAGKAPRGPQGGARERPQVGAALGAQALRTRPELGHEQARAMPRLHGCDGNRAAMRNTLARRHRNIPLDGIHQ